MIKNKDLEIMMVLRMNSRSSLKEIQSIVNLPISTIYDRITFLLQSGFIKRFTSLLCIKPYYSVICVFPVSICFDRTFVNALYRTKEHYLAEMIFPNRSYFSEFKQKCEDLDYYKINKVEKKEEFIF